MIDRDAQPLPDGGRELKEYAKGFSQADRSAIDATAEEFLRSQYVQKAHGFLKTHFPALHESDVAEIIDDLIQALREVNDSRLERVNGDGVGLVLAIVDSTARDLRRHWNCRLRAEREYAALRPMLTDEEQDAECATATADCEQSLRKLLRTILHGLQLAVVLADLDADGEADNCALASRLGTTRGTVYVERHLAHARLRRNSRVRSWLDANLNGNGGG